MGQYTVGRHTVGKGAAERCGGGAAYGWAVCGETVKLLSGAEG